MTGAERRTEAPAAAQSSIPPDFEQAATKAESVVALVQAHIVDRFPNATGMSLRDPDDQRHWDIVVDRRTKQGGLSSVYLVSGKGEEAESFSLEVRRTRVGIPMVMADHKIGWGNVEGETQLQAAELAEARLRSILGIPEESEQPTDAEVWSRLEATPGFNEAMTRSVAQLNADRGITFPAGGQESAFDRFAREVEAEADADPTGQARAQLDHFREFYASLREKMLAKRRATEQAQAFDSVYTDLGSYLEQQLTSPGESAEHRLDDDAAWSMIVDLSSGNVERPDILEELLETEFGNAFISKLAVPDLSKFKTPDSAFIRLSNDARGRLIRLGFTFKDMPDEHASTDFGIELSLAETDGNVDVFERKTDPDGSGEVLETATIKLSPDQLRNISQVLRKYSPSGTEVVFEADAQPEEGESLK